MTDLELFILLTVALAWVVSTTTIAFILIADHYVVLLGSRAANELETAKYAEEPKAKSTLDKVYSKLERLMIKFV